MKLLQRVRINETTEDVKMIMFTFNVTKIVEITNENNIDMILINHNQP